MHRFRAGRADAPNVHRRVRPYEPARAVHPMIREHAGSGRGRFITRRTSGATAAPLPGLLDRLERRELNLVELGKVTTFTAAHDQRC